VARELAAVSPACHGADGVPSIREISETVITLLG